MLLETVSQNWTRARSVNATTTVFNGAPTLTAPVTADAGTATAQVAVQTRPPGSVIAQNGLRVVAFGVGADTNTFSLAVVGWAPVDDPAKQPGGGSRVWVPTLLVQLSCELDSGVTGVTGGVVPASNYFATTLTLTYGDAGVSVDVVSPGHGNGWIASALLDLKGYPFWEPQFITGGSATNGNCLFSYL